MKKALNLLGAMMMVAMLFGCKSRSITLRRDANGLAGSTTKCIAGYRKWIGNSRYRYEYADG